MLAGKKLDPRLGAAVLLSAVLFAAGCSAPAPSASITPGDSGAAFVADIARTGSSAAPAKNQPSISAPQHITWSRFQGKPDFDAGSGEGLWVWNTNVNGQNTLFVFATTEGHKHVFTGIVRTGAEGNFWDLDTSHLEKDDHVQQPAYDELHFDFTTYAGTDGFSAHWSGRDLTLDLKDDGQPHPLHVHYGASGMAAHGLPLIVDAGNDGLLTLPLSSLSGHTMFHAGAGDGYWINSEGNAIHLRTTTTSVSDHKYYTGQIFGELSHVSLFSPDDDWLKWPNGDHADFGLRTNGSVDGVDMILTGSSIIFTLRTDEHLAAPNIALGSNGFGMVHALTFRLN